MKRRALLLLLLAPAAALAAPPAHDADRAARAQTVQALILKADADSLATAALLSLRQSMSPTALELAVSAAETAPRSAPIGWLHLQLCTLAPNCDVRDVATVLRWVDAENGSSWLPILGMALKDKDWTEVDRVIGDMAQAPRFDLYWNRLVVLMTEALRKTRATLPRHYASNDAERYDLISGTLSELIPGFSALLDACRTAPAASDRREECLKVSRSMQKGDTVVTQIAGFGLERRLLGTDSRELPLLAERRRLLESRIAALDAQEAKASLASQAARARQRLAKMRTLTREEDVYIALLRESRR